MLTIHDEKIPLSTDAYGIIRIAGTRVTLECVAEMFEDGASPEEIAQEYDALQLSDVYAVITYLLRNRDVVKAYLSRRSEDRDQPLQVIEEEFPQTLRSKLLRAKRDSEANER